MNVTFSYDGASQLIAACTGLAPSTLHTLYADDSDSGGATATSDAAGNLVIALTTIGGLTTGQTFVGFLEQGVDTDYHGLAVDTFAFGTASSGGAGLPITWEYDGVHTIIASFAGDAGSGYEILDTRGELATGASPLSLDCSASVNDPSIMLWVFYDGSGPTPTVNPDVGARIFIPGIAGEGYATRPNDVTLAYATTTDLFRILKVREPSAAQTAAAQGDLDTATLEINWHIDWADDHPPATTAQLELMKGVCLDRAADIWRHRESAPGILGITDEQIPSGTGRYSFARYAMRLRPLKDQFGVA